MRNNKHGDPDEGEHTGDGSEDNDDDGDDDVDGDNGDGDGDDDDGYKAADANLALAVLNQLPNLWSSSGTAKEHDEKENNKRGRGRESFDDDRNDDRGPPCPKYHNTEVELAPC